MGLATHAIALALGYALGNPEGRAQLVALRGRAQEAAKRPEVKQARERAWDLAGEAGVAAKNKLTARSRRRAADSAPSPSGNGDGNGDGSAGATPPADPVTDAPATTSTAPTATTTAATPTAGSAGSAGGTTATGAPAAQDRLAGTTVAEDSRATVLGVPAPDVERPEPPAQR